MISHEWPKAIDAFMTSDHDLFQSRVSADDHQRRLDGAILATQMIKEGASVGASLRAGGFVPDGFYPELDGVTKDTKLVISHWQCSDKPGYSPCRVNHDGQVMVYGDAGAWTGAYGNWCTPTEIVSYLLRMKEAEERAAEYARRRAAADASR